MEGWNNGLEKNNKEVTFMLEQKGFDQQLKTAHFTCVLAPTIPAFHYPVSGKHSIV